MRGGFDLNRARRARANANAARLAKRGNPERKRFPCSSDSAGVECVLKRVEWAFSFGILPKGRGGAASHRNGLNYLQSELKIIIFISTYYRVIFHLPNNSPLYRTARGHTSHAGYTVRVWRSRSSRCRTSLRLSDRRQYGRLS